MKRELPAYAVLPPCPVTVVCTYDADEKPNCLAGLWTGNAVAEPPHVMIAVRPGRYSHAALCERGEFTLYISSEDHMCQAAYFVITCCRLTIKL